MKRIFFVLIVAIMGLAISCNRGANNAQQEQQQQGFGPGGGMGGGNFNPEEMAQRQVDQMKETLGLSNEQAKQFYDLTLENSLAQQKMREEMQNSGGGFEGMREQMQKSREEQNQKFKSILSDEQWVKYQAYQEEMNSRRGQGGPGGMGGPRTN
jgi:periplasmic protein CpxP/Spy